VVVLVRMYETLPAKRHVDVANFLVERGQAVAPAAGRAP